MVEIKGKEMNYSDMPNTIVVIPAYNEAENIGRTIDLIRATELPLKIVIVDDGSTDKTAKKVQKKAKLNFLEKNFLGVKDNVEVILTQLGENKGKGVAFFKGLRTALRLNPEAVIFLDADMLTVPKKSLYLLAKDAALNTKLKRSRMIVGAPYENVGKKFYPTPSNLSGIFSLSINAGWRLVKEESRVLVNRYELETFLRHFFRDNITIRQDAEFKAREAFRHISKRAQDIQIKTFKEKILGESKSSTKKTNSKTKRKLYKTKKEERLFKNLRMRKLR